MAEARESAERELGAHKNLNLNLATALVGRRIGWALLDLADAVRDHAAAQREETAAADKRAELDRRQRSRDARRASG